MKNYLLILFIAVFGFVYPQTTKDENIVFIHTGGSAGLFAYHDLLKT